MKNYLVAALVASSIVSGILPTISIGQTAPKPVDLCKAIASAAEFSKQYVVIHGNFEMGIENTDISSPNCEHIITIHPTEASKNDPGFNAIIGVSYCPPMSKGKRISGDFVGRFEWLPEKNPRWVLYLDKVSNLHIEVDSCGEPIT